jgi:hypothetical protein
MGWRQGAVEDLGLKLTELRERSALGSECLLTAGSFDVLQCALASPRRPARGFGSAQRASRRLVLTARAHFRLRGEVE